MDRDDLRSKLEPLVFAGQYADAQKIITKVLSKEESAALQAEARLQGARILIIKGEWDKASGELEEARRLAEATEDYHVLIDCLNGLGEISTYQGHHEAADGLHKQALELAREHTYPRGEAGALIGIGSVLYYTGRTSLAMEHSQHALALSRQIGWRLGEAASLKEIANARGTTESEQNAALAELEQALEIITEIDNRWFHSSTLGSIGVVRIEMGDPQGGLDLLQPALVIDREMGYRFGEGVRLGQIGAALAALHKYDEALTYYEDQLRIAEELESPLLKMWALLDIGRALVMQHRFDDAVEPLQEALRIANEIDALGSAGDAGLNLGLAFRGSQRYDEAKATLLVAKARYDELGDRLLAGLVDYTLARIDRDTEPEEVPEEQKAIDELADVLDELKKMWQTAARSQSELERYLSQDPSNEENRFVVLKQWNSFTPIFAFRSEKASGGGYYLNWRGRGVAIDPGFSFIENLYGEGFSMTDLHAIVVTHAHLDHTNDMEPLLDLLHQYTELTARGSKAQVQARSKSLDFFLNLSSFCRFSEGLAHCDGLGVLHPLKEGQRFEPDGYDVAVLPVDAKHEELGKRRAAIGLLIDLLDRDRNCLCRIGITGDSGYAGKRWARKFSGLDILVAHIGTISEDEVLRGRLYDQHLGFRGLFRLCEVLGDENGLPQVLLISEFGEELKGFRLRIAELLQNRIGSHTKVFAGDVGLRVQLSPSSENIHVLCGHGHPGKSGCISQATDCLDIDGHLVPVCTGHPDG